MFKNVLDGVTRDNSCLDMTQRWQIRTDVKWGPDTQRCNAQRSGALTVSGVGKSHKVYDDSYCHWVTEYILNLRSKGQR